MREDAKLELGNPRVSLSCVRSPALDLGSPFHSSGLHIYRIFTECRCSVMGSPRLPAEVCWLLHTGRGV